MKMTISEINKYITERGWTGSLLMQYLSGYEQDIFNREDTPEEGYRAFCAHRGSVFRSVSAEFQASHSAMSEAGAEAYANNWN